MSPSIYLCRTVQGQHVDDLVDSLGRELEKRTDGGQVGIFRVLGPAGDASDPGIDLHDVLEDPSPALAQIISAYGADADRHDAMVIVGSDYSCALAPVEFEWNATVAANLGAPLVVVLDAKSPEAVSEQLQALVLAAKARHATVAAAIVLGPPGTTRPTGEQPWAHNQVPIFYLHSGTVPPVKVAQAGDDLDQLVASIQPDSVVAFAADDWNAPLAIALASTAGKSVKPLAGLSVGRQPVDQRIKQVWNSLLPAVPLLHAADNPADIRSVIASLATGSGLVSQVVDTALQTGSPAVTPMMFEQQLLSRARAANRHIVLPESEDDRILQAADRLVAERIGKLTILGDPAGVKARASQLGLNIDGVNIVDPANSELYEPFAKRYAELRAKKGVTIEQARERMLDGAYFGTMMVLEGHADGMVSGAAHTTAHTIRPALEVVKTKPGVSVVSSVFLMCLPDHVLVFGDCAVNPNPTPEQIAEIAISSATTAKQFGIDPKVAMLSYSSGDSGQGPDVDAMKEATQLVKQRAPQLVVDGPLQYDAAVAPDVGAKKMPGSPVAGQATVLIFPSLSAGNIAYKAVQRSAAAFALGPVLQGLNKPVNDLSRGALVPDIVNTVAITAIQASEES